MRASLLLLCVLLGLSGGQSACRAQGDAGWIETLPAIPVDTLQLRNLTLPSVASDCARGPMGPLRLPPRPGPRALGVILSDGRPSHWDSLFTIGGVRYWPMEEACYALGASLSWQPELLRGELGVDSLRLGFVVGGEVIRCGARSFQMRSPVLYTLNRLLLPLEFLPQAVDSLLADRFEFRGDSLFLIQRPPGAPSSPLQSQQVGNRTYLTWPLTGQTTAAFRTDGAYGLAVDIPGFYVDPLDPPAPEPKDGACLWAIRPHLEGTEFILRVDPSIRAWRVQWRRDPEQLRLTLSSNLSDRAYRTYRAWEPIPPARSSHRDGPIVLVLPEEAGFVRDVGERLRERLEAFGWSVALVEDVEDGAWTAAVNSRGGVACLCLRADRAGDQLLPGCRIVIASDRPGERSLYPISPERGSESPPSDAAIPPLLPWDRISAPHDQDSRELGWLLGLYLETEFPALPLRHVRWPAASFEGLDVPGAMVYLGRVPAGSRSTLPVAERLAGALAGCLRSYLRTEWDG